MTAEPTYPADSPVGEPGEAKPDAGKADESNATAEPSADKAGESNRTRHIVTGAAIGVGSAALVAALLYANRSRGGKDDGGK
jgi:hypothetical protein